MTFRDDQSDQLVSAYLDGELGPDQRAQVERLLSESDHHRQLYEELVALRARFESLGHARPSAGFKQRVVREAERRSAAERESHPDRRQPVHRSVELASSGIARRRLAWTALAAIATVLLIAAGIRLGSGFWSPGLGNGDQGGTPVIPWEGVDADPRRNPPGRANPNRRTEYFLVYDLAVTPKGFQDRTFQALLFRHGIDTGITQVDPRLQEELLKSRFLEGVKAAKQGPPKGAKRRTEVYYVVATAKKFEDVWQELGLQPDSIAGYRFDLAMAETDLNLLARVDRAADQPLGGGEGQAQQVISALGRAQRLVFSVALHNTSSRDYRRFSRDPVRLEMPDERPVPPPQLGHDEVSRVLFVLRAHDPAQVKGAGQRGAGANR